MRTRLLLVSSGLLALSLASGSLSGQRIAPSPGPSAGLRAVFSLAAGGALKDTNGDGLADGVAARVILAADPSAHDVQVATNLAARLGYETTALTLPIALRANEVPAPASIALPIVVGRTNPFVKALVEKGAIAIKDLAAGQGLVAFVSSPLGGPDGIAVVGGDDAGTLAAGTALAAYLPRLWGAAGSRIETAEQEVAAYLKARGVPASQASVTALVIDSDRRGLKSLVVRTSVGAAYVLAAMRALGDLDLAHRRGAEADVLNFANVAATVIELWSPAGVAGTVTVRRSGLNPRALTPPDDDTGGPTPAAAQPAAAAAGPRYDLLSALTIDGWLADSYPDLIADRVDATLVIGSGAESLGAAHIAARLGLESTGIAVPIVRRASEVTDPSRETNPILVGRDNAHVETLVKIGRARLDGLAPGEGVVQVIPRAFGPVTATVVAGADAAGTDAAAMYLARRVPFVWDNRRGSFTLDHMKTAVTDFFGARTGGGQAGLAVAAIDDVVKTLADRPDDTKKSIETFGVKVFFEEKNPAFDQFLEARLKTPLAGTAVKVESDAITSAVSVFDDTLEIPWEVDDFRKKLAEALPQIAPGAAVELDVRLSESPEMRRQLADDVRRQLVGAGAKDPQIHVRSAYKQGFTWMMEEVMPALKGRGVTAVHVKIKEHVPDFTKKFRFYTLPTRWLHELYPIDEVFKRDLGLPTSAFTMELVDAPADVYHVEARNRSGVVVHRAAFSPKVVEREYLDKFPGWSRVEVTTGWMTLRVDGKPLVDERIATDPERFWDFYQSKVLPRIHEHVMKLTNNRPTADLQPFHRDLDVEVWMSEPDYRIGIDEEQVSSIEALHEDLYFVTLDFYNAIGRNLPGRPRLGAPGKIFPIMHGERRGQPGTARVHYAANAAPRARIEVTYKEKGTEKPVTITRDLARVDVGEPEMLRAVVTTSAVREIEVDVAPANDREAARAADLVDMLGVLHTAGLYRTELSYANVGRVVVSLPLRDARPQRALVFTGQSAPGDIRTSTETPRLPLVTWDHVIGPDEAEELVRKLSAYPTVTAYRAGKSYRGRDVSVLEIQLPTTSEQVSVTKMTALKPTIFITGRQHANEVSSTSHILKLAELLATDATYTALLKKVNVILHPVENPDGAAMAYELQKLTPTHMLHAGRYSALGQDVGGGSPLLPESQVRGRIWREWRPDIYLNPHGYPSHEWVQQFAGYVSPQFRSYWSSRGWYTQLSGVRDPRYPELSTATDALRDAIARNVTQDTEVRAKNREHQDRYRRWAFGFSPFVFGQEIYQDAAIYYTDLETGEPRGGRRVPATRTGPASRATMGQWPNVTFNSGMTEAPDETAQGAWLDLVSRMGFSFLMAHVNYLHDGNSRIETIEEGAARDGVARTTLRIRPVRPRP
ncbi:MAG: hypothetical protein EXQ49_07720 [Acidobacteria bacterium]|nr:hypothetical protein [Acidobacteriota bacterium]